MTERDRKAPPRPMLDDTCMNYLQIHAGFEDQRAPGSYARQHIDHCASCQQYLARVEWERRKEEEVLNSPEVEALVAEYARRFRVPIWQRRRFIAAASVFALGALGLGAKAWFGRGGPRPVGNGGSPTPNLDRAIEDENLYFDRLYQEGGASAVGKVFARGSLNEVQAIIGWIDRRQHVPLIPMLVGALGDSRIDVRWDAVAVLGSMPPLSVKPYQAALDAAAANEADLNLATAMQALATRIAQAR